MGVNSKSARLKLLLIIHPIKLMGRRHLKYDPIKPASIRLDLREPRRFILPHKTATQRLLSSSSITCPREQPPCPPDPPALKATRIARQSEPFRRPRLRPETQGSSFPAVCSLVPWSPFRPPIYLMTIHRRSHDESSVIHRSVDIGSVIYPQYVPSFFMRQHQCCKLFGQRG